MFNVATLCNSSRCLRFLTSTNGLLALLSSGTIANAFVDESNATVNVVKLRRVELFPAGQGVFEYGANSIQNTKVKLRLSRRELDDALKSLVLQGFEEARVDFQREILDDGTPIDDILRSDETITRAELLQRLRGNQVRLINEAGEHVGRIVTVENQADAKDREALVETVTLATSDGLAQFAIDSSVKVRLENELLKGLELALDRINAKDIDSTIEVGITLSKREPGPAAFAYQSESAPWKCSYRVISKGNKAELVVSAVIDNDTHNPWEDIELVLIVDQPLVFHSPLSFVHSISRASAPIPAPFSAMPPNLLPGARQSGLFLVERSGQTSNDNSSLLGRMGGGMGGMGGGMGGMLGGAMGGPTSNSTSTQVVERDAEEESLIKRMGISFNASDLNREAIGKRVHIRIPKVTVPSNGSATHFLSSIPHDIRDIRVYVSSVHKSHPLSAFEITLHEGYQLPGGPGTVWGEHGYSGDVMIPHLIADIPQMITYAVDQDLEIQKEAVKIDEDPFSVALQSRKSSFQQISPLVVAETQIETRLVRYKIKNLSKQKKQLIIEHASTDPEWRVVTDKPTMPINHQYTKEHVPIRFELMAPAQSEWFHDVHEERSVRYERTESTALAELREAVSNPECPKPLKDLISSWISKKEVSEKISRELTHVKNALAENLSEQKRLLQSIAAVSQSDNIYARYLKKLDEVENGIEQKSKRIAELQQLVED